MEPRPETGKSIISHASSKKNVCRICLSGAGEDSQSEVNIDHSNPLISPCKCSGTMELIHVDCLKEWLSSKINTKTGIYTNSYNWKNLECELCKMRFRDQYEYNNEVFDVLDYTKPTDCHYIVLESFTNTPHKTIHVT